MRGVGPVVAEFGHVGQLVVDHRRAEQLVVDRDGGGLGGAVDDGQLEAQQRLDEDPQLGGERRGAATGPGEPAAQELLPQLGQDVRLDGLPVGAGEHPPVELALVLLVEHFADPWHQRQLGGPDHRDVLEEGRHVAARREVADPAAGEGVLQRRVPGDMAHRHVVDIDGEEVGEQFRPGAAPHRAQQPVGVHRALGRSGASRGVDEHRQRVVVVLGHEQRRVGERGSAADDLRQGVDDHVAAGLFQALPGGGELLELVADFRVVVEDHQSAGRGVRQQEVDGDVQPLDARRDDEGLGLLDDRGELRERGAGLQRDADHAEVVAGQIDDRVVTAGEAEQRDPFTRRQRMVRVAVPFRGHRADPPPEFAVAGRLVVAQEAERNAAGVGIPHELLRAFTDCGPIRVALHDIC